MNPNIDFLGICQLLKALQTVGFSENEIKRSHVGSLSSLVQISHFTLDFSPFWS